MKYSETVEKLIDNYTCKGCKVATHPCGKCDEENCDIRNSFTQLQDLVETLECYELHSPAEKPVGLGSVILYVRLGKEIQWAEGCWSEEKQKWIQYRWSCELDDDAIIAWRFVPKYEMLKKG